MIVLAPVIMFVFTIAVADAAYSSVSAAHPTWQLRAELAAMLPAFLMMVAVAAVLAPFSPDLGPLVPPDPPTAPWRYL